MKFRRKLLLITYVIYFFNIKYSEAENEPKIVCPNSWECVTTWPKQDVIDLNIQQNSEFFYLTKRDDRNDLIWKINKDFIDKLDLTDSQTVKLSFKYWSSKKFNSDASLKVNIGEKIINDISGNYDDFYKSTETWMPFEVILSKAQLNDFQFDIMYTKPNAITAIKDILLEYENIDNYDPTKYYEAEPQYSESYADDGKPPEPKKWPENCPYNASRLDFENCIVNKNKNTSDILVEEPLNIKDTCIEINYWLKSHKQTEIDLTFKAIDDSMKDKLLTIKLKWDKDEKAIICLSQLLAVTAREFIVSHIVRQRDINGENLNIEGLYLQIKVNSIENKVKFNPNEPYLTQMKKNFDVKTEWDQIYGEFFQQTDSGVHFSADIESGIPASAHYISKWIKFNPTLFEKGSQYIIEVKDQVVFQSFRVRPMICDQLSHCIDVYQTNRLDETTKKTIDFNFDTKIKSKYIKLLFYVEYFKPAFIEEKSYKVEFDLKLMNFGNPCDKLNCENDECTFNIETLKAQCACAGGTIGDTCQETDFCNIRSDDDKKKCHYDHCINLKDGFKCLCLEDKINWNDVKKQCEQIEPKLNKWKSVKGKFAEADTTEVDVLVPSEQPNDITYEFTDINNKEIEGLTLEYKIKSTSDFLITVNYKSSQDQTVTFKYYLMKDANQLKISTKDFIYKLHSTFTIMLSIDKLSEYNKKDIFMMSNHKLDQTKKVDLEFNVPYWDTKTPHKAWLTPLSGSKWSPDNNHAEYTLTSNAKYYYTSLASPWIAANNEISGTENSYTILISKIAKELLDKFKITPKIIYQNEADEIRFDDTSIDKPIEKNEKTLAVNIIDKDIAFKIIFEIEIDLEEAKDFEIKINSVVVADPCYKPEEEICKNNAKCKSISPILYQCECDSSKKQFGDHCEFTKNVCKNACKTTPFSLDFEGNNCHQLSDTSAKCDCSPDDYIISSDNKRCVRTVSYIKSQEYCSGSKCQVLDKISTDYKWSNKDMPQITDANKDNSFPFYFTNKNGDSLDLTFDLKDKKDVCFTINYKLPEDTNLLISHKDNNPIKLFRTKQIDNQNEWNLQEICASYLKNGLDSNPVLNIKFDTKSDNQILLVHIDKTYLKDDKNLPELYFLKQWNSAEYKKEEDSLKSQWPFHLASDGWKFKDSLIEFKGTYTSDVKRETYLFSHWIAPSTNIKQLRFNLNSDVADHTNYNIRFLIYDDKMNEEKLTDLLIGSDNFDKVLNYTDLKPFVVDILPRKTSFRVALKVEYKPNSQFELINLDLGDPCIVLDEEKLISPCKHKISCKKDNKKSSDYKCNCDEDKDIIYDGKNCEIVDLCKSKIKDLPGKPTGDDYCAQKNWKNCSYVIGSDSLWDCNCQDERLYWLTDTKKCEIKPKCIGTCDSKTQECVESKKIDGIPSCKCKDNFVDMREINATELNCVEFDFCNSEHRKKKSMNPTNPCGDDTNAICLKKSDADYTCKCANGYETQGDKASTKCTSIKCKFPALNNCQQKCVTNEKLDEKYECGCDDGYEPDTDKNKCKLKAGEKCDAKCDKNAYCLKNKCKCEIGFKGTDDGKNCLPDPPPVTVCPNGLTNDTLSCNCGDLYKLNEKTLACELKPICGVGGNGRETCNKQGAYCIINKAKNELYVCECPTGQLYDKASNKCVNYCDFKDRENYCMSLNAKCDPSVIITDDWKPSNSLKNDNCLCYPGFTSNADKECQAAAYSTIFNIDIKNEFTFKVEDLKIPDNDIDYSKIVDIEGIKKDIKSTDELNEKIANNIKQTLGNHKLNGYLLAIFVNILKKINYKKNNLDLEECELKKDYYSCSFAVIFSNENDMKQNLTADLTNLCHTFDNKSQDCFVTFDDKIVNPTFYEASIKPFASPSDSRIILNIDNLNAISIKPIQQCAVTKVNNKQLCGKYSVCHDEEMTSLYSCKCNEEYFTSKNVTPNFPVPSGMVILNQECEAIPFCKTHCVGGLDCIQQEKYLNDEWIVDFECRCDKGNSTIKNSNSTKPVVVQCADSCQFTECKNGDKIRKEHACICQCKDKWSGDTCDNDLSVSTSNVGWITGIVILALLVVAVGGVAVFFQRRSRANNNYSNNQPLDEFNQQSYRVPSNPQSRGQSNPAFHRD